MRKTLGTTLLVLCLGTTARAAEPSPVLGVGSESCATWLRERAVHSPQSDAHVEWVLGYLSLYNDTMAVRDHHSTYSSAPRPIDDANWAVSRVNTQCQVV